MAIFLMMSQIIGVITLFISFRYLTNAKKMARDQETKKPRAVKITFQASLVITIIACVAGIVNYL